MSKAPHLGGLGRSKRVGRIVEPAGLNGFDFDRYPPLCKGNHEI